MVHALSRKQSPESKFWALIRPKAQWVGHFFRIENTSNSGTFDVNYAMSGGPGPVAQGWLELKVVKNNRLIIRKYQRAFARTRLRITGGTSVWFLVFNPDDESISLFHGSVFIDIPDEAIISQNMDEVIIKYDHFTPSVHAIKPYKWDMIFNRLKEDVQPRGPYNE